MKRPETFIVPPRLADWLDDGGHFDAVADWLDLAGIRGALLALAEVDAGLLDAGDLPGTAAAFRDAAMRAISGWEGPDGPQPCDVFKLCWIADVLDSPALAERVGPLLAEALDGRSSTRALRVHPVARLRPRPSTDIAAMMAKAGERWRATQGVSQPDRRPPRSDYASASRRPVRPWRPWRWWV